MNTRLDGQEAGYSWNSHTDKHDILEGQFKSPWFVCRDEKLRYSQVIKYSRYMLEVVRTTQPLGRSYPRLVESVSLADRSSDSLMQPKDWGKQRADLYARSGVSQLPRPALDWNDIKPLTPFFVALHPLVRGGFEQGSFLPLFDWFAEQDTFFARWFAEPGPL